MQGLPWFRFYVEDWLTSDFRIRTGNEEHGAFWNVMALIWNSTAGGVSDRVVYAICDHKAGVAGEVINELVPHPAEPDLLTHPKLFEMWDHEVKKSKHLTETGRRAALKRWREAHAQRNGLPMGDPMREPEPEPEPEVQEAPSGAMSDSEVGPVAAKRSVWAPEHDYAEDWNILAQDLKVPKVQALTPRRKQHLKAREADGLGATWPTVLSELREANREWIRGFRGFSFDWVIRSVDNWTKILEGRYRDAKKSVDGEESFLDSLTDEQREEIRRLSK